MRSEQLLYGRSWEQKVRAVKNLGVEEAKKGRWFAPAKSETNGLITNQERGAIVLREGEVCPFSLACRI